MALSPHAIPTNEEMVESLADRFYEPHKRAIWIGGAVLLGGVLAFLGVREYRNSRLDDMWARFDQASNEFVLLPYGEPDLAGARKQADALQALVKDYPDDPVTPFALLQLSEAQVALGQYDDAKKSIDELQSRFKDFPLNTLAADADASGHAKSLSEKIADSIKREKDWVQSHEYKQIWPSEDRLALVETNVGSFWLSFYDGPDQAPKHVAAFIEHAKHGDYNGSQVYRVIQSAESAPERFEAGSMMSNVNSKLYVADPADHDKDEPTDTIEPEDTRFTMRHPYRIVCAAKMDSGESATRFVVVTKKDGLRKLDGESTPFAAVIDREKSLDTLDTIGRASTYGSNPDTSKSASMYRMRDHPYPAIYIRRVSIWSKEKLEDGHTWDTSRAGKGDKEPWEDKVKSPKPEEFEKKTDEKKDEKPGEPKTDK